MNVFTHTEPGGKAINEDFVIARRHPSGGDRYICLLADGQGGQSNGGEAARAACETAWNLMSHRPFDELLQPENWTLLSFATDSAAAATGGFTTLVALAIDSDTALCAACGDCKTFFTKHNATGDISEWTLRQQRNPPVGSGEAHLVPCLTRDIGGGRVLMLSDGVWKYCGYEAIRSASELPAFSDAVSLLRSAALSRSGHSLPDDFSIIGIEID